MKVSKQAIVLLAVLAFMAFLLWTTLSAQKVQCDVCVEFTGERNCATASAADETMATRSAQTTACGVLAKGMSATIACANTPPVSRRCRTR